MQGGNAWRDAEAAPKAVVEIRFRTHSYEVRSVRRTIRIEAIPLLCLATAILVISGTRVSFAHSGTADEQSACTPDVLSLCFWDIPNEDKIVACLNKNLSRLSPACHKVIAGDDDDKKDKRSKK
jgi:hypothetical protein